MDKREEDKGGEDGETKVQAFFFFRNIPNECSFNECGYLTRL